MAAMVILVLASIWRNLATSAERTNHAERDYQGRFMAGLHDGLLYRNGRDNEALYLLLDSCHWAIYVRSSQDYSWNLIGKARTWQSEWVIGIVAY